MTSRSPLPKPVSMTVSNATRNHGAPTTPTTRRSHAKRAPGQLPSKGPNGRQRATSGDVESIQTKRCDGCGEQKPATAFLPSKFTPDHLTDQCKRCTYANAEHDRREREARRREAQARREHMKTIERGMIGNDKGRQTW